MSPTHPLDAVFRPRSVAVIGASRDPRKRGHRVLGALRASGYAGSVHAVNPKGGVIDGHEAVRSVDELPAGVDLALVCTPAHTVPEVVEACGRSGVRAAVVLAVGFRESGGEGAALEARILESVRTHGIRVVGPNTSGLLNLSAGLNLIGAPDVRAGGISLLVQSGNVALEVMNAVTARTDQGIAICLGVGNEVDVGFAEALEYLGADPATRVIVVHAEGFRDGPAFLDAAERVARDKPVLLIKGARSEPGRAAARSHTGAVAGAYDRLRAALARAGVVEVRRTDELVHVAETLAGQPPARPGAGVAILSDGGGQGTLAADALAELGVPLPGLGEATRAELRRLLGGAAAVANPVDVAGAADADPEVFARTLEVLVADPAVGAVLHVGLFGGYGIRFHADLTAGEERAAERMVELVGGAGVPLVVHTMYATRRSAPLRVLTGGDVPVVESLEVACRCIAEAWRRGRWLARAPRQDRPTGAVSPSTAACDVVRRARSEGRAALTEPEARMLLSAEGVPFARAVVCATPAEAALAGDELGWPVALKAISARILHKTDAGAVRLGVASPAAAETAFGEILARCAEYLEANGAVARIDGVLASPMLPPPLAELLVGAQRDPDVGPVLTLGAGGTWVEVSADVAHRRLPLADQDVPEMLDELRIGDVLAGARGGPPADLADVLAAAHGVAALLLSVPDVEEVEVNPLFVYADRAVAVDARVLLERHRGEPGRLTR